MLLSRLHHIALAAIGTIVAIACGESRPTATVSLADDAALAAASRAALSPGEHRQYGPPLRIGEGRARAYAVLDARNGRVPREVGVALDADALAGLPLLGSGHHDLNNPETHERILTLPSGHGTPFQFVQLNWNPGGHEPPGIYDAPHFDFHFYTVSQAERDAIVPNDPLWATKANNLPAGDVVPPFNVALGPPGASPAEFAVPMMGVHWADVRSAELQGMLGNPAAYRPFATTFLYGSWDGRFTFLEPMITRAHLLAKQTATDPAVRDELLPISVPERYRTPGYYPTAYRIQWDPQAREYRIGLAQLVRRD
jgi:hypothetical protein